MSALQQRKPRFRRVKIENFTVTGRDTDIIRLVAHHRFMRSTHILNLLEGSSRQGALRRLERLFHGGYLARPPAQLEWYRAGSGSSPMVYSVGNEGIDLLAERFGFRRAAVDWTAKARTAKRGEIEHALEVTDFMVALELACRHRGNLRVLHLADILATVAPAQTRENPRPYFWPVPVRWQGKEVTIHPIPDKIFGIEALDRPEGRNRKFFFLEADRGTMPAVRLDLAKTSFLRKLLAYGHTYKADLHTQLYGFTNMRVLTVTRGRPRIEGLQEAHREYTWQLCSPKVFLFADRTTLLSDDDFLGHMWIDGVGNQQTLLE
jgi:Replication-relaxation